MAKKKKKSNKLIYILIGAVVLLIIVAMVGKSKGWIGKKKQLEVELGEAKNGTIIEKVSASGAIQPIVEVKLSPDVSGEIIKLTVEEGDAVTADQLLVKIRPDNLLNAKERAEASLNQQRANLASSRASLSRAEASLLRAKQDFDRQMKLREEGVISDADMELSQQNYDIAKSDKSSAEQTVVAAQYIVRSSSASLEEAKENVRLTSVKAPIDGIVSKLVVKKGERVVGTQTMTGTEMLRIADLNNMEVRVAVNENDIIRITLGDTAIIDVDSYAYLEKKFKGIVTAIANTANDKASADAITEFEVKIKILNSSFADLQKEGNKFPFRPGMTASVDIVTEQRDNILIIPLSSVTTRDPNKKGKKDDENKGRGDDKKSEKKVNKDDLKEVVFIHENGIAKMVVVKTGISDYENIQIISGVEVGAEIVVGPFLAISKRLKGDDDITFKDDSEEENEEEEEEKED
jgi:HlyD family secretion protein